MQSDLNLSSSEPANLIFRDDKWQQAWRTMVEDSSLNYVDPNRGTSLSGLIQSSTEAIYTALVDGWTLGLGYSSGKDSETCLHLLLMALIKAVRNGEKISQHSYILHTDTRIENPEVRWLADQKLKALQRFVEAENLPLTIILAKPGLTQSWTGRVLTGRGIPTFANSASRQCTHELKIVPAERAKREYMSTLPPEVRKRVCLMLGSRDAESATRANNIKKQGGQADRVFVSKEGGKLYAIKNWLATDVWEFLLSSGSESRYVLPSYLPNNMETAELYKDATGECVWSAGEKRSSEACTARFGCALCQAAGLDKSMETLLASDPERYGYMSGLNRLQRFIAKRRYAWEDRHPIGRTLAEGGYVKMQPDVYSPRIMERILHVCCSLDYVEQRRADKVAKKLSEGLIDNTPHNQRMSNPQFRLISEEALLHVDWAWSFHQFNSKPFHAMEIFHRVWSRGELDLLDDEPNMEVVPRTPIPQPLWVKVKRWGDGSLFDGLADHLAEMSYFDGGSSEQAARVINTSDGVRRVVRFEEQSEVMVDAEAAAFIIWEDYPSRLRKDVLNGHFTAGTAAQFYLRFGALQLARGKAATYHKMMQRGQTYERLMLTGYQTMEGIAARKDLKKLSDSEYRKLIARRRDGRLKTVKWWLNLNFTIQYHLHHNTQTGCWIESQLRKEGEKEVHRQKRELRNSVVDALLLYTSSFSQSCLFPLSKSKLLQESRYLAHEALRGLSSALEGWGNEVLENAIDVYSNILRELDEGSALACHLDWVNWLSKKRPEVLKRHVKVMIRVLREFLAPARVTIQTHTPVTINQPSLPLCRAA